MSLVQYLFKTVLWKSSLEGKQFNGNNGNILSPLYHYLYSIVQDNITHCTDYQIFGLYFTE